MDIKQMRIPLFIKKIRTQNIYLIPFIFTFANALFGFLSVIKALDDQYVSSAVCILLAALMDLIDGRLARFLGSCSSIGKELDSLCDAISFCCAPAILIYSWSLYQLPTMGPIVLGLYICAGLLRLARFNVNVYSSKQVFIGLATTAAAFFIATCVIYSPAIVSILGANMIRPERVAGMVTAIALLMVSAIKFPSFKVLRLDFITLSCILACGGVFCILYIEQFPFLLACSMGYIIGGFCWGVAHELLLKISGFIKNRL